MLDKIKRFQYPAPDGKNHLPEVCIFPFSPGLDHQCIARRILDVFRLRIFIRIFLPSYGKKTHGRF